MVTMRESTANDDLRAMQDLVQRIWTEEATWHIGDLAWQRSWLPGAASDWRTGLWEEGGQVLAWGWIESPDALSLAVDPAYPDLADEVIAWFERATTSPRPTCAALKTERHITAALERAGYGIDRAAPWFTHHHVRLDGSLMTPVEHDGFTVRHIRADDRDDLDRRAAVHRAAWSDFGPSSMLVERYRAVMSAWPYRPELDWVVEKAGGDFVASALVWLDDVNGVGLLEPVGCAPVYRRRGLTRAVNLAALHALRAAGATAALVCPRGDRDYPIPGQLYRSIGFQPGARTVTYVRSRSTSR